jgi:hypothetical protein
MKISRILFSLTFIGGIIIIGIGLFLKLSNQISWGTYTNRFGDTSQRMVNGMSALIIGFLLLVLSFIFWKGYKREKEKLKNMD